VQEFSIIDIGEGRAGADWLDQLALLAQHGEQGLNFIRREREFRPRQYCHVFRQYFVGTAGVKVALMNSEDD
jgi:hypothetical protein